MKREEKFEDTKRVNEYTNHCTTGVIFYSWSKMLKVETMHVNQRTENTTANRKRTIAQTKD